MQTLIFLSMRSEVSGHQFMWRNALINSDEIQINFNYYVNHYETETLLSESNT